MILIIRCLPFLVGVLEALLFWFQLSYPHTYPWVVVLGVLLVPATALCIGWKQVRWFDLLEKMMPTFLLMLSLAFGVLLVESYWAIVCVIVLAGVCSTISLELLFLLARHPSAYPVNGLSHVNIAYVPLVVWYAVFSSMGLFVFLHVHRIWHLAITMTLGVLLFRTTGHPGASREQNIVWSCVGLLVGLEVGWVGTMLPLSLDMQAVLAALTFSIALRIRRYVYHPKPSKRIAWSESIFAASLFLASIVSAKWL